MNASKKMLPLLADRLPRREFLKTAGTALGLGAIQIESSAPSLTTANRSGFIDVNVNLSRWPARRLRHDDTREFAKKLRHEGVTQAWAGSFDALLHKDIASVNSRLAEDCRKNGRGILLPFGSVNPMLPDWEEEMRRCAEDHHMPGIRLHPNYHGYKLDDPAFSRLLRLASERHLIVQLAVIMEDERMMHPLLRVPAVDARPLPAIIKEFPSLRLVLINALSTLRGPLLIELLAAGQTFVEISMIESVGGIGKLLEQALMTRILFGSHAPFFYLESALLKMKESILLPEHFDAIRANNAQRLMAEMHPVR